MSRPMQGLLVGSGIVVRDLGYATENDTDSELGLLYEFRHVVEEGETLYFRIQSYARIHNPISFPDTATPKSVPEYTSVSITQ